MLLAGLWQSTGCTFGELPPEERPILGDGSSSLTGGPEPSLLPALAETADRTIPPVSGGTLEANDDYIVAGDPTRDVVWIIRHEDHALRSSGRVDLPMGAEPGRLLLRGDRALVVLRGAGTVADIDLANAMVLSQTEVCEAPRGIDARRVGFVVACVDGSLVFLDDALRVTERRRLVPDLRDVVVEYDRPDHETLWVSTYRKATVLEVREDETVVHEIEPLDAHLPRVAWRMRAREGGGVDVLHQQMSDANFTGAPLAYYGSARTLPPARIVRTALVHVRRDGSQNVTTADGVTLAVDFVRQGNDVSLAAAYVRSRDTDPAPGVYRMGPLTLRKTQGNVPTESVALLGDLVVSFSPRNGLLVTDFGEIPLANPVIDTGHDLFHATTPAEVTCASCHPAGRDDAYVWQFSGVERRTQPLTGGLLASGPYHWAGDLVDLEAVVFGTFDTRMDGPDVTPSQVAAMGAWLDGLPALRIPSDDLDAVARGELAYGVRGCADCHDATADPASTVLRSSFGNTIQAPPLFGVGLRAPYFVDGCAETLHEALGPAPCAAGHPVLTGDELDDMVTYLEQL